MGDLSIFVYLLIQSCICISMNSRVASLFFGGIIHGHCISVVGVVQPQPPGALPVDPDTPPGVALRGIRSSRPDTAGAPGSSCVCPAPS